MTFDTPSQKFIYTRTYARWLPDLKRRETWEETVERYINFIQSERSQIPPKTIRKIRRYMTALEVMPSMRALWAAGEAAAKDNIAMYNCAAAVVDNIDVFGEALYILMCGCGFGYNVQKKYVSKLPVVAKSTPQDTMFAPMLKIEDSKIGWASSITKLMKALYKGSEVYFNYDGIRPEGARLKTMGGRASGPVPLIELHSFMRHVFREAQGRQLTPLECSDIMNKIAACVVMGGVRRSSEICLSDLDDEEMRNSKTGNFPQKRFMANVSAVYEKKPTAVEFLQEWGSLAASGTGERGIFNLQAAKKRSPQRRVASKIAVTNPCGEVLLRDGEFCNLSEVVIKETDNLDSLLDKVETATWIGVIQSTFTDFRYLRLLWKENCEEERLLGVSLTGQMDAPHILTADALKALKARALRIKNKAAKIMEIKPPVAVTLVKPSGTVSQLVNSASGVHPRYSRYYIRRYRINATDPLYKMMKAQGVSFKPEVGQKEGNAITYVVEFPVKSPPGSVIRDEMTALEQLEWYKKLIINWCEHNVSCTVYVRDDEWFEVGDWVYRNWDYVNGVSFLPYDGGVYELAPYEEITKEEYENMTNPTLSRRFPDINYDMMSQYELEDMTEGSKELACSGNACEI